jgi:L-malate glycosyltransferase
MAPKLKIALCYDRIYPWIIGGAEKRYMSLGQALARKGHEVTYFSMKLWEGPHIVSLNGVRVEGITEKEDYYDRKGQRRIMQAVHFAKAVVRVMLSRRFDIVDICNFPYLPALFASLVARFRNQAICITWLEFTGNYWREYLGGLFGILAMQLEKLLATMGTHHIAISDHTRNRLLSAMKSSKRIPVIPFGLDLEYYDKIVPSTASSQLIYYGRLHPHKRVDWILKAARIIRDEMHKTLTVIIIGSGPEEENLKQLARELRLEGVTFLPEQPEEYLLSMVKGAQLLVMPSAREGLGLTVIESMALGVPALVCRGRYNAAVGVVESHASGVVVGDNPECVALGIRDALIPATYQRLKNNCSIARRSYDIESTVEVLEQQYMNFMGR